MSKHSYKLQVYTNHKSYDNYSLANKASPLFDLQVEVFYLIYKLLPLTKITLSAQMNVQNINNGIFL